MVRKGKLVAAGQWAAVWWRWGGSMESHPVPDKAVKVTAARGGRFRPGDLVTTTKGYPVLYEVLAVDAAGLLRVRGLNWAAGYSATVTSDEVRSVTSILNRPA